MIPRYRLAAADLALTATGLAWTHTDTGEQYGCRTAHTGTRRGHPRIHLIWQHVQQVVTACRPDLVVIEGGYVGGNSNANTLRLAELRGVITHWLYSRGVPYVQVPPACLKQWATGSGATRGKNKVAKDRVRQAVTATYGRWFHIGDDNAADAVALLTMATAAYGRPLADLPVEHTRALRAVEWPDLPLPTPAQNGATP